MVIKLMVWGLVASVLMLLMTAVTLMVLRIPETGNRFLSHKTLAPRPRRNGGGEGRPEGRPWRRSTRP